MLYPVKKPGSNDVSRARSTLISHILILLPGLLGGVADSRSGAGEVQG